jgi:hypothetical protein
MNYHAMREQTAGSDLPLWEKPAYAHHTASFPHFDVTEILMLAELQREKIQAGSAMSNIIQTYVWIRI